MTPQQTAALRNALLAIGLISPTASDAEVQAAWAQYQAQNPAGAQQLAAQSGVSVAPATPWITIIGVLGGAVAVYMLWQHYNRREKVDAYDYPDPNPGMRMKGMSRSLNAFKGLGAGCRSKKRKRMGDADVNDTYEFEPEIRLEGYRKRRVKR